MKAHSDYKAWGGDLPRLEFAQALLQFKPEGAAFLGDPITLWAIDNLVRESHSKESVAGLLAHFHGSNTAPGVDAALFERRVSVLLQSPPEYCTYRLPTGSSVRAFVYTGVRLR